jgi:selenocysteine lyase/cysteine desulfurase
MSKTAGVLPNQRALFDLPADVTFLNCAYMAPHLKAVTDAGVRAVQRSARPWSYSDATWFDAAEALRAAAARLMQTDADGVALVPAASYGIAVAAANVPVRRGQNVVVLHEAFPSNFYAWRELSRERGAELRRVTRTPAEDWTGPVLEAIDDATAVVAVPYCHWTDGTRVDLVAVGERARAVGAALVVDASQAFGALPLELDAVRPDFLASVGYKWQLGPYSLGYLYAAPRWRREGRPLEYSWATRAGADNFAALVDYTDEYRPGARRFDVGECSHFVLAPMALAGLEQLLEWDVARVQATLRRLTDRLADAVQALGWTVLARERRVGHLLGIRLPDGVPPGLLQRLAAARVHVSLRGSVIRVSPHVYNDEADIDRLVEVLREFA